MKLYILALSFALTCIGSQVPVQAQSASLVKDYTPDQIRVFFDRVANQYRFSSDKEIELELTPNPILVTAHQTGIPIRGSIYLWTDNKRPALLVNLFTFQIGQRFMYRHCVNSLFDQQLTAELNGRVVWTPKSANLKWTDTDLGKPAQTESRRLLQIRSFARRFKGNFGKLQVSEEKDTLRLMPQPLYRYSSPENQVQDGVLMALASETTPVVFLMIELVGADLEQAKYRWALVRTHYVPINVYLDDEPVWSTERIQIIERTLEGQQPYSNEPYFAFFSRDPIPPPEELTADEID